MELKPTLEMEETSQSAHDHFVDQTLNGIDSQNHLDAPEVPEPELQTLDLEEKTKKVEEREEQELSDDQSESSIRYDEIYQLKSLKQRKLKSRLRSLQASSFLRLMEDRMAFLESELAALKNENAAEVEDTGSDTKDNTSEDDIFGLPKKPYRKIDDLEWKSFQKEDSKDDDFSVLRTLKGEIGIGKHLWISTGYFGSGETYEGDMEEIDSQVIIDFAATFRRIPQWASKLGIAGATFRDSREMTNCSGMDTHFKDEAGLCMMCENDSYWPEDQIERIRSSEYLTSVRDDLQTTQSARDFKTIENKLILLSTTVFGFALRSRKWDLLPPEEGFDDLVIKPAHKQLVQALVKTHARVPDPSGKQLVKPAKEYQADIVRGKGRGIIILLHGPPGVGKTSTAECVAELTKRPLFQITCGDIGTDPESVERNLDENFRLAHRWECVLLLDEADVFLQERDRRDLKRNSLVSVFLRTLEYYSGILFLTTNREGIFDEAFVSRIHTSLHYQKPSPSDWLKIWKNNIRRVSMYYDVNETEILQWAKSNFQVLKWNGRQIRNAFQTATAMAKYFAQEAKSKSGESTPFPSRLQLGTKDFAYIAEASIGFDEYLQSLSGFETIEDRVLRDGIRNDRFHNISASTSNNLNQMYQSQTLPYQGSPRTQQRQNQYQAQQAPGSYHQPPGQFARRPAPQHQQHLQGPSLMQNMESVPNAVLSGDFWGDENDMSLPVSPQPQSQSYM